MFLISVFLISVFLCMQCVSSVFLISVFLISVFLVCSYVCSVFLGNNTQLNFAEIATWDKGNTKKQKNKNRKLHAAQL